MAREALKALIEALPRCCYCEKAIAAVINVDRWPLCEPCWDVVPHHEGEEPAWDMRAAIQRALAALE